MVFIFVNEHTSTWGDAVTTTTATIKLSSPSSFDLKVEENAADAAAATVVVVVGRSFPAPLLSTDDPESDCASAVPHISNQN